MQFTVGEGNLHVFFSNFHRMQHETATFQVEGKEFLNEVFPTDVDSLFTMYFTRSRFFQGFHDSRKSFGASCFRLRLAKSSNFSCSCLFSLVCRTKKE